MLVLFGLMLTLSACSMTKKQLGLSRDVPDESTVETRRPLDLPPDYNILPD
jgi:uncharacterized lipoprotein